jgi:hypothetical protein
MKSKFLFFFIGLLVICATSLAQIPKGFNYQAIARDGSGNVLVNVTMGVKLDIQTTISGGTIIYEETFSSVTSNSVGLITLVVGSGTQTAGNAANFAAIDWNQTLFLKTSVKYPVSGSFTVMGTSQIWSVPYALVAEKANGVNSGAKLSVTSSNDAGTDALFEVKRADGQTVFAVYPNAVNVYVPKSTFKGVKGGFAVGGYDGSKAGSPGTIQDYLRVTPDSVRIYVDPNPTASGKGVKGGFAVGGYDESKGINSMYFNLTPNNTVNTVASSPQILWYPKKNAFLAGNIHIGHIDSVGNYSTALGYQSRAIGDYSQAFGYKATAFGNYSTSIGKRSIAGIYKSKNNAFALGNSTQATGEDSYAFGSGAIASGEKSFAFGSVAIDSTGHLLSSPTTASGAYTTAIGMGAQATSIGSQAFGNSSASSGYASLAMGFYSIATGNFSVAIGYYSKATNTYAHTFGLKAQATGIGSLALGMYAYSSGAYAAALGRGANSAGGYSSAVGYYAQSPGLYSGSFGYNAIANGQSSVAVGYLASTLNTATGAGAFGNNAKGNGISSVAIGYNAITTGQYSGAFGYNSLAAGQSSVAVGSGATTGASATDAGAFGKGATANGTSSVAIGNGAIAGNTDAGAFGKGASASGQNSIAIGNGALTGASATNGGSFGNLANATGSNSMALGTSATASGANSVAMGYNSLSSGQYSLALGYSSSASNTSAVSLGYNTTATGLYSTSVGYQSQALGDKSLALGSYYTYSYLRCVYNKITGIFSCNTTTGNVANIAKRAFSSAIGNGNYAEDGGMALGSRNSATSSGSIALGYYNTADTSFAFAAGRESKSHGISAIALGDNVTAEAASSLVIGSFNATSTAYNKYQWVETDPIFVVGNGDEANGGHDAFRINKNGGAYLNPENAYAGLWITSTSDANYGSTYQYSLLSKVESNKAGVNYYSGYFYHSGSTGNYQGEYADTRIGGSVDLAEYIYDSFGNTQPADVVVADPEKTESVVKSSKPYQTGVLGVISTKPHMTMGSELVLDEKTGEQLKEAKPAARLALSGRVPVNVCGENGDIKPGDYLTSSSKPGVAMKWSLVDVNTAKDFDDLKKILAENERRRGAIIGKAVESFSGTGMAKIKVLISLQ